MKKIVEGYLKHLIQHKQFKCNAPEIQTHWECDEIINLLSYYFDISHS